MSSDNQEPTFVILAPDEPDLEKMQKRIMDMLTTGSSVNDISIALHIDPNMVQGYADKLNKQRWQEMNRASMRSEHVMMLNEMAELGKLQYMADPKPPQAFAVASILKTANEILKDLDSGDSSEELKEKFQDEVLKPALEQLVFSLTKEIGQARNSLVENLPEEKRPEASRMLEGIARALAVHTKIAFDDALNRVSHVLEESSSKNKVGSHKKSSSGIVSLVPHVDPR